MVQILPQFDPGKDVGQAIGSGFGDAMKLLGQRQLGIDALSQLENLDVSGMSLPQVYAAVGKATIGLPHMQKHSAEMAQALIKQQRTDAYLKSRQLGALGGLGQGGQGGPQVQPVGNQVLPQGVAPAQGQQPIIVDGYTGSAQPGVQQPGAAQPGVQQPVEQVDEMGNQIQPDVQGEQGDLREVPTAQGQKVEQYLASPEEIRAVTEPHIILSDLEGMTKAVETLQQNKLKERELKIEDAKVKNKEREVQRALENEIAQKVLNKTQNLAKRNNIDIAPEQYNRLAYKYFQDERNKTDKKGNKINAKASDEEIWQKSGVRLERKINDIAGASNEFYRPTWRSNPKRRAEQARKWAQSHLSTYGNSHEDRDLLKTILMDSGWSRAEASTIVQPLSQGLEKAFKSIDMMKPVPLGFTKDTFGSPSTRRATNFAKKKDAIVDSLEGKISPSDSLFVLKNRLVREKQLEDNEAIEVIDALKERGLKLQDHQIAESPYVNQNTMPSLYDIIWSGRSVLENMEQYIR